MCDDGEWREMMDRHDMDLDDAQERYEELASIAGEMAGVLGDAVDCGMIPKSSAKDGGASRFAKQVHVADSIRTALSRYNKWAEKQNG